MSTVVEAETEGVRGGGQNGVAGGRGGDERSWWTVPGMLAYRSHHRRHLKKPPSYLIFVNKLFDSNSFCSVKWRGTKGFTVAARGRSWRRWKWGVEEGEGGGGCISNAIWCPLLVSYCALHLKFVSCPEYLNNTVLTFGQYSLKTCISLKARRYGFMPHFSTIFVTAREFRKQTFPLLVNSRLTLIQERTVPAGSTLISFSSPRDTANGLQAAPAEKGESSAPSVSAPSNSRAFRTSGVHRKESLGGAKSRSHVAKSTGLLPNLQSGADRDRFSATGQEGGGGGGGLDMHTKGQGVLAQEERGSCHVLITVSSFSAFVPHRVPAKLLPVLHQKA